MVIDSDRQELLGTVLTYDILVKNFLDFLLVNGERGTGIGAVVYFTATYPTGKNIALAVFTVLAVIKLSAMGAVHFTG